MRTRDYNVRSWRAVPATLSCQSFSTDARIKIDVAESGNTGRVFRRRCTHISKPGLMRSRLRRANSLPSDNAVDFLRAGSDRGALCRNMSASTSRSRYSKVPLAAPPTSWSEPSRTMPKRPGILPPCRARVPRCATARPALRGTGRASTPRVSERACDGARNR
jgi:hypothetical protein